MNEDYSSIFASLPVWRRLKVASFRFEEDRRQSIAAWLLLREMLLERGVNADALSVRENEYGKPSFNSTIGIHFSISHSGERVMVAIADTPVGCDIEKVEPINDELLEMTLTPAERNVLAPLSGVERDREFVRLWVRKESYAKAVGKGVNIDLESFSALDLCAAKDWTSRDYEFEDNYLGCVVSRHYA